jgi:hypothetical protein
MLKYSDGIAATRTLIAREAHTAALQRRLPNGWELAPLDSQVTSDPRRSPTSGWSRDHRTARADGIGFGAGFLPVAVRIESDWGTI